MEIKFERTFYKDIDKVGNQKIAALLKEKLLEIESASSLRDVGNVKKLSGDKNAFRIKVADYRIGIYYEKNFVEAVRFLHRKEIYRYFP